MKIPLLIIIGIIFLNKEIQTKPVIGVMTNSYHDDPEKYDDCYIKQDTVKWLEAAGAEVIPIHCWSTEDDLLKLTNKINGIYLQTGTYSSEINEQPSILAKNIIRKVIELKERNKINLPLWGSGMGMEIMHSVISGSSKSIDYLSNSGDSFMLYVFDDANKQTRLFSYFSDQDIENINNYPLSVTFSTHAIGPREYNNYRDLDNFFFSTSYGMDENKKTFIASVEAKNYEIYGTQFDPESICYNRNRSFTIPKGINAVRISHNLSNFFINTARKNKNVMTKAEKKTFGVINSFDRLVQNRSGEGIYRYIKSS